MKRGVRRTIVLLAALALALTFHMLLLATSRPVVRMARLTLAGWPAGAPPLRIVLLSDIHTSMPSDTPARLAGLVALVDGLHPDLILLAGDFLGTSPIALRRYSVARSITPLEALRAPLGVVAVPGNHDRYDHALGPVEAALARAHIPLLINQVVRRGPIAILALDDYHTGRRDIPGVLAQWRQVGGVAVALTHDPAMLTLLPGDEIGVRLAGHTHCGQISPPPVGPLVPRGRIGGRYVCGVVREQGRVTIVTGGVGTSVLPLRLGAPPDLWLITLQGR